MATSSLTARPDSADTRAVTIVTPADGPSLGTAPAGTWMCTSWVEKKSSGRSSPTAGPRARTKDTAAWADSRITSPSCPVTISRPLPGMAWASTKRISPPAPVTASPVATPGSLVRRLTSLWMRSGPRISRASSGPTTAGASSPSATRRAMRRAIAARRRSSWRTPASRVYSAMTVRMPSSVTSRSPSGSPAASICRGSR